MHSQRLNKDLPHRESLQSCPCEQSKKIGRFIVEELQASQDSSNNHGTAPPPVALAYFRSRWGEVDGYLPVLHRFKEEHPGWRMIAIIASERMSNTVKDQPFFYNELKQTVDTLIRLNPQPSNRTNRIFYQKWISKIASWYHRKCVRLSWRHIFSYLKNEKIELIFKDHGSDNNFLLQLQSIHPAKCVSTPHGTGIFLEQSGSSHKKTKTAQIDLFLAGDPTEIPCFQKTIPSTTTIQAVGRPRYDRWWMEHLAQLPAFRSSEEYKLAHEKKRVFLFATRGPSSLFFPKEVFEYLVNTVAEITLREPDTLLLIKPHPQQDLKYIKSIMAQYDSNSWRISSLQTMQLAQISDFVICMVSSVILDALAVGKPTVEFFQYVKGQHYFLKNKKGKTVSAYGQLGMVATAERKDQLEALIENYFNGNDRSEQWEDNRQRTKEFMKLDNNASSRAIMEIDKILTPQ
jgi:hypothetical protein